MRQFLHYPIQAPYLRYCEAYTRYWLNFLIRLSRPQLIRTQNLIRHIYSSKDEVQFTIYIKLTLL
jgi:hypothetical protein